MTISTLKNEDTVYIRSNFSAEYCINIKVCKGINGQINFKQTTLTPIDAPMDDVSIQNGIIIHNCGDDATPWKLNGTYIGGNHGCSDGLEVSLPNHGFTDKELGSEWLDSDQQKFYLIKVVDQDKIWVLSENKGEGDIWQFSLEISGDQLVNSDNGRIIAVNAPERIQITPACRFNSQTYLVDGKTPLPDNVVTECQFLDIIDNYDIIAPDSLLEMIIRNAGKKSDFAAAELDSVVNNKITYQFQSNGACVIDYHACAKRNFNLEYMGFIQTAPLNQGTFATHNYYIPKTLPFEEEGRQFDFLNIQAYTRRRDFGLFFKADSKLVADKNDLPDRFVQLLGNKDVNQIGYAAGYSLIEGLTQPETRAENCERALFLWRTQKTYPSAIDCKMGPIQKGRTFHCIAYRQYFSPPLLDEQASAIYWHNQSNSIVLYAHYHKSVEKTTIKVPNAWQGKQFTIVEKTAGITIDETSDITEAGISLSNKDNHGYAVLRIKI